jgi:hypothetical protein
LTDHQHLVAGSAICPEIMKLASDIAIAIAGQDNAQLCIGTLLACLAQLQG